MLLRVRALFIVRTIRNIKLHSVGRMQSLSVLEQVIHVEPLGFEVLKRDGLLKRMETPGLDCHFLDTMPRQIA
jgi:hypothetical protein